MRMAYLRAAFGCWSFLAGKANQSISQMRGYLQDLSLNSHLISRSSAAHRIAHISSGSRPLSLCLLGVMLGGLPHAATAQPIIAQLPGPWKYSLCDEAIPNSGRYATWCAVYGGSWHGINEGGCTGATVDTEATLTPNATKFETLMHSACNINVSSTGWMQSGQTLNSGFCWSGGDTFQNGIEVNNIQRISTSGTGKDYSGNCTPGVPFSEDVMAMKSRVLDCSAAPGYTAVSSYCTLTDKKTADGNFGTPGGCVGKANPVNMATGNKFQVETDYRGAGMSPLEFVRTYNRLVPANVSLGPKWRHTYERWIVFTRSGTSPVVMTAKVYRADGKAYYFNLYGTAWTADNDISDKLQWVPDANGNPVSWTYITANDERESYDATGRLNSITNRAGLAVTLTYNAQGQLAQVQDTFGKTLKFEYGSTGLLSKMIDPANQPYVYGYNEASSTNTTANNLTSVTYPDTFKRIYYYESTTFGGALTGIGDENGKRFATFAYDAQGRVAVSEHAGGAADKYGFVYNADGSNTVTDPLNTNRTYIFVAPFTQFKLSQVNGPACSSCGVASAATTYDANGNVASRTDFKGNKTCYTFAAGRNLETVRLEGVAPSVACPANLATYTPSTATGSVERKITTTWHTTWRFPLQIAEPLRITTNTYDATTGNLLTKTVQPTTDTTGGAGLAAVAAPNSLPRTSTYTYYATTDARNGLLHTIDGPRTDVTDVTTYDYDTTTGNLTVITNALNQITTLGNYDAHGKPGRVIDPNGLITDLTYYERGWLHTRTSGGELTSYTYDGVGQLKTVTLSGGATYTYTYDDAHRLTDITDNLNNHIHYTLDAMGNRTKEETFNSSNTLVQTHSRIFDALNHLYQDIGAVNQTTTYAYDANGNLTDITDPLKRQTMHNTTYDALNRLSQTTDAAAGITQYGYDGLDQLAQVTDPKTLITQYVRDGVGNLKQQTSPDTGVTGNTYDAAGNLKTRTDAKNQLANYAYDALNRLTGIAYSVGGVTKQTVAYVYDQGTNGIGHLTQIVDSTGTTNYGYDQHGRLTSEARQVIAGGATYTTGYVYDTQGRLKGITYPSGRAVNYAFDGMGRINQISTTYDGTTKILTSNITYEPFGGVHSFTYGDGLTAPVQSYTRQRDQDGRIASYTLNGKLRSIGYDDASQIKFITDPANLTNTANYDYDALSHLNSFTQSAISQGYTYDADGNRSTQTLGSTISTYGYVTGSNRLASIQTGASTQNFLQDANGATSSDATRQYGYDLRGRLIQVTTAQGVINYEVNALGLRVRKKVPYASTDTLYHYDTQGHLIGESPAGSIQFTREYIYLGDQPVAVMQ